MASFIKTKHKKSHEQVQKCCTQNQSEYHISQKNSLKILHFENNGYRAIVQYLCKKYQKVNMFIMDIQTFKENQAFKNTETYLPTFISLNV